MKLVYPFSQGKLRCKEIVNANRYRNPEEDLLLTLNPNVKLTVYTKLLAAARAITRKT